MTNYYIDEFWTSKLIIYGDKDINDNVKHDIKSILDEIEYFYSSFKISDNNQFKNKKIDAPKYIDTIYDHTSLTPEYIAKIINYDSSNGGNDFTCMLKGYALNLISDLLIDVYDFYSFVINFGGDVLIHNVASKVKIDNTNFYVSTVKDKYCIFTSGNTTKRGDHIVFNKSELDDSSFLSDLRNNNSTLTTIWYDTVDPIKADALTTRIYGNFSNSNASEIIDHNIDVTNMRCLYGFLEDGTCITNSIYCASPFFNEKEIAIRDKMVSKFKSIFRPDQTESSKSYDVSPGPELAKKIYEDNINHLKGSLTLVFPEGTKDLGTLYEVGYMLGLLQLNNYMHREIIRYNYERDEYYILDTMKLLNNLKHLRLKVQHGDSIIIDCSEVSGAVYCGYLDALDVPYKYYVGNLNDNIMLSINHTRVDENGNDMVAKYEVGM